MPADAVLDSIAGLQQALRAGRLSASEALQLQQARFSDDGALQCVVHRAPPGPVPGAGALLGVALAHKDVFALPDRAPGLGRPAPSVDVRAGGRRRGTAHALQRLASHGATNLGALAMAELACGATAENPHGPQPVNPLDAQAAVGGSSSGSAVAVAAGLCLASLGTDTAGSVRIPAATCGIVGFKPGRGRVDPRGVMPLAPSLDTVGVLARSADCAAHVYAALRPGGALSRDQAVPGAIARRLGRRRGFRVASVLAHAALDPGVADALATFERALAPACTVRSVALQGVEDYAQRAQIVLHAEAAASHAHLLRESPASLAPSTRAILLPGVALPAPWYLLAMQRRASDTAAFVQAHLQGAHLLLTPALPRGIPDWRQVHAGSPAFDAAELLALHRYHAFVNYLGLPAIVFPIGADRRGRPVCVQAIGHPHGEETLLAFAHRYALPVAPVRAAAPHP